MSENEFKASPDILQSELQTCQPPVFYPSLSLCITANVRRFTDNLMKNIGQSYAFCEICHKDFIISYRRKTDKSAKHQRTQEAQKHASQKTAFLSSLIAFSVFTDTITSFHFHPCVWLHSRHEVVICWGQCSKLIFKCWSAARPSGWNSDLYCSVCSSVMTGHAISELSEMVFFSKLMLVNNPHWSHWPYL